MSEQIQIPDYNRVWTDVYGDMQDSGPVHRHMKRIVRRLLQQIEYYSVLDVGSGPGHNFSLLCQGRTLGRVTGVDISSWAVEQGRKAGREICALDIQRKKLDGRWDLVFSSLLLEHLPDDMAALRNMRSMTGRHLLVTTMAGDFERYKACDARMGHVRNYRVGELEQKLSTAGFSVQKAIYWGFPFYTPLARSWQNHISLGTGKFGPVARMAAEMMYCLYFLNSHRCGDLLVVRATV